MGRGGQQQRDADQTSQRQLGYNQQALDQVQGVNQVDQQNPWGSQTWGEDGSLATSLNEADQGRLGQQRDIKQRLLAAALAGMGGGQMPQGMGGMPMGNGGGKQGAAQQPPPMPQAGGMMQGGGMPRQGPDVYSGGM